MSENPYTPEDAPTPTERRSAGKTAAWILGLLLLGALGFLAWLLWGPGAADVAPDASAEPSPTPTVTVTVTETPTPEPTPTETATETPTPTPEPTERADYGFTWLHDAQIGTSFADMSEALGVDVVGIDECPYFAEVLRIGDATVTGFSSPDNPGESVQFFSLYDVGGPIEDYPRNDEDLGVGSSTADVLAAYPDAVQAVGGDIGTGDLNTITVDDPDSDAQYVFASFVDSDKVDVMQWGENAGVQWSHLCGGF